MKLSPVSANGHGQSTTKYHESGGVVVQKSISLLVAVLFATMMIDSVTALGAPGVNTEPDLAGTEIASITHDEVAKENQPWLFSIEIDSEAIANGTTVEMVTVQICVNQGICLSPKPMELDRHGNNWSGQTIPHWAECTFSDFECLSTYVNWKVTLNNSEGNLSTIPETGFYTTWSSCWIYLTESGGDGCPKPAIADSEDGFLPGFGIVLTLTSLLAAGVASRVWTHYD